MHLRFRNASLRWPLAAGLLLLLITPICRASGPLNIDFDPNAPIILSIGGTLSYDAGSGKFHSESDALTYNSNNVPNGFATFTGTNPPNKVIIDLNVNPDGSFNSNGTGIVITGSLDLDGDGTVDVSGGKSNPLLFGSITNFGSDPAGPPTVTFQGLFSIDGGQLTQDIPLSGGGSVFGGFPKGGIGAFILFAENVTSGTLGDFSSSFSSNSVKDNEGVFIPEPATAALGLVGAAMLGLFGRVLRRPKPAG
jgi:hypothetical protein